MGVEFQELHVQFEHVQVLPCLYVGFLLRGQLAKPTSPPRCKHVHALWTWSACCVASWKLLFCSPSSPAAIPNSWSQKNLTGWRFKTYTFSAHNRSSSFSSHDQKQLSLLESLQSEEQPERRELWNKALHFLPLPPKVSASRKQEMEKEKMDQWRQCLVRHENILRGLTGASKKGSASPANSTILTEPLKLACS